MLDRGVSSQLIVAVRGCVIVVKVPQLAGVDCPLLCVSPAALAQCVRFLPCFTVRMMTTLCTQQCNDVLRLCVKNWDCRLLPITFPLFCLRLCVLPFLHSGGTPPAPDPNPSGPHPPHLREKVLHDDEGHHNTASGGGGGGGCCGRSSTVSPADSESLAGASLDLASLQSTAFQALDFGGCGDARDDDDGCGGKGVSTGAAAAAAAAAAAVATKAEADVARLAPSISRRASEVFPATSQPELLEDFRMMWYPLEGRGLVPNMFHHLWRQLPRLPLPPHVAP